MIWRTLIWFWDIVELKNKESVHVKQNCAQGGHNIFPLYLLQYIVRTTVPCMCYITSYIL